MPEAEQRPVLEVGQDLGIEWRPPGTYPLVPQKRQVHLDPSKQSTLDVISPPPTQITLGLYLLVPN